MKRQNGIGVCPADGGFRGRAGGCAGGGAERHACYAAAEQADAGAALGASGVRALNSIAGETTELAKPVMGTIVPAPQNFPSMTKW